MAFKVKEICQAEAEAHLLEVVYSHLKLRQLRLRAQQTANGTNGTSNGEGNPLNQSYGHPHHDTVIRVIYENKEEQGIGRAEVYTKVGDSISRDEVDRSLEYLSNEGHIYSTIDEDHFKAT